MTVSLLYFLVSFLHGTQLWADGQGMPCSAQNLGHGITANSMQLTDTVNWSPYWNCMKLTNRKCFTTCCPLWCTGTWTLVDRVRWQLSCTSYVQLSAFWSHQLRTIVWWRWITHNIISFSNVTFPSRLHFSVYSLVQDVLTVVWIHNAVCVRTLCSLVQGYEWFEQCPQAFRRGVLTKTSMPTNQNTQPCWGLEWFLWRIYVGFPSLGSNSAFICCECQAIREEPLYA
jgi:hypothetical protein